MQNPVQLRKKHSCSNWLQVHRNHFPLHQTWVRLCLSRANSQLPGPLANCNLKKKLMLFAVHTHTVCSNMMMLLMNIMMIQKQLSCLHIICCTNDHMWIPWGYQQQSMESKMESMCKETQRSIVKTQSRPSDSLRAYLPCSACQRSTPAAGCLGAAGIRFLGDAGRQPPRHQ